MMIAYSINFKGDRHSTAKKSLAVWDSLGEVGQFSVFLLPFMAVTPSASLFVARARKRRRRNETYLGFFLRDIRRLKKKKRKQEAEKMSVKVKEQQKKIGVRRLRNVLM